MTKQEAIAAILDSSATPIVQAMLTDNTVALFAVKEGFQRNDIVSMVNNTPGDGPFHVRYGHSPLYGKTVIIGAGPF